MRLQVTGVNIDVGDALRKHCEERLQELKKFFDQIIDIDVHFKTEKGGHHFAEVSVFASGISLHAEGDGADFYVAVDTATAKLSKQLKKYKGRLQKHRKRRQKDATSTIPAFQSMRTVDHSIEENSLEDAPEDLFAEYTPKIVHKDIRDIQPLSVDEAVMQMDLMHKPAFVFQNSRTGELNIVYRQTDGTVRWVEPHLNEEMVGKQA